MRKKLEEEILKHSKAKNIEEAKTEWRVLEIRYNEKPLECLCWQKNIKNIWLIRNKETGEEFILWENCIDYFLNQDYSFFFNDIKKIAKDITKAVSTDTLHYCMEKWFIYSNDICFYETFSKCRKIENLPYQLEVRKQINREILAKCYRK